MRSSWVNDEVIKLVLAAMMPPNRLALEISEATGLRIDDVLSLKTELVERTARPYVVDSKTGKRHRVYFPAELREKMLRQAGKVWIFPGRIKPNIRHRTRQAVHKDMIKAAKIFKRNGTLERETNASPHSMRKRAAVRAYHRGGLDAAADLLMHSEGDDLVTMIYALADTPELVPRTRRRKKASAKTTGGKKGVCKTGRKHTAQRTHHARA